MHKVIQLCLIACINKTTFFSFLSSLLREKWQMASLPEDIHSKINLVIA